MGKYLTKIIIIIFILIGAALFAFKLFVESKISIPSLEKELSQLTNMNIKIKDVKATLSGRLFLNQVTASYKEKPVMSVERLVAGVNLWEVIQGKVIVKELGLETPVLNISKPTLIELTSRLKPPVAPGKVMQITIQKGELAYDASPTIHISLKDRISHISLRDINGSFKTDGKYYDGNIRCKGNKNGNASYLIKGRWSQEESLVSLEAKQIPLAMWKSLLAPENPTAIEGVADLELTAKGVFPDLSLEGKVDLKDSSINGYPVKELKSSFKTNPNSFTFAPFALSIGDGIIAGEADGKWPSGTHRHYTILVNGKMKSINLEKVLLPNIPIPIEGILDGNLSLESKEGKSTLKGDFLIPNGRFKNGPEFSALKAKFVSSQGEFYLSEGKIVVFGGDVAFNGNINKTGKLFLDLTGSSLDLSKEDWLKNHNIEVSPGGSLKGNLAGKLSDLSLTGKISVPRATLSTKNFSPAWNNMTVNVKAKIKEKKILSSLLFSANKSNLPLSCSIKWVPDKELFIETNNVSIKTIADFIQIPSYFYPINGTVGAKILFYNTPSYNDSSQMKGNIEANYGRIAGQDFDKILIDFKNPKKESLSFSGLFHQKRNSMNFDGELGFKKFLLSAHGKNFPIQDISMLNRYLPYLKGLLTFDAAFSTDPGKENFLQFSLPDGYYKGRSLPKMEGELKWDKNILTISHLTLPSIDPPLNMSGSMNLANKEIYMSLNLNGQNIQGLTGFLPAIPISPENQANNLAKNLNGKLYGNLKVTGAFDKPKIAFTGKVSEIMWEKISLREGALSINGNLSINGAIPSSIQAAFHTDSLKLANLPWISKYLPTLSGTASMDLSYDKTGVKIAIKTTQATFQGRSISAISGNFSWKTTLVAIEQLELPLFSPPLNISGVVNTKTQNLDLAAKLSGQNLTQFSGVIASNLESEVKNSIPKGELYGNLGITGSISSPKISFHGKANALQIKDLAIGSGQVAFSLTPINNAYKIHFLILDLDPQKLDLISKQIPNLHGNLKIEGDFTASTSSTSSIPISFTLSNPSLSNPTISPSSKNRSFPAISGTLQWQPPLARLTNFNLATNPPIGGSGEIDTSSKRFTFHSTLSGHPVNILIQLAGLQSPGIDAKLKGHLDISGTPSQIQVHFNGKGWDFIFNELKLGKGLLDISAIAKLPPSVSQPEAQIQLKAERIQAQDVALLQNQYPGLTGQIKLQASFNTKNSSQAGIHFDLKDASRHGERFPSLDGTINWQSPNIYFSPLLLPDTAPPLDITGNVNTKTKQIIMDAQLSGQSLATLMKLAGATSLDMDGKLYGPIAVRETYTEPLIIFKGKLSHLIYKGTNLGDGDLTLHATPRMLDGKLYLHSLNLPIGLLGQLFGISLGNAQPIIYIKGTPKDPKIIIGAEPKKSTAPTTKPEYQPPPKIIKPPSGEEIIEDILEEIFKPKKKKK